MSRALDTHTIARDEHRRIARHLSELASSNTPSVEDSACAIEMVVDHLAAHPAAPTSQGDSPDGEPALASHLRQLLLHLTSLLRAGAGPLGPTLVELEEAFRRHVALEEAAVWSRRADRGRVARRRTFWPPGCPIAVMRKAGEK